MEETKPVSSRVSIDTGDGAGKKIAYHGPVSRRARGLFHTNDHLT